MNFKKRERKNWKEVIFEEVMTKKVSMKKKHAIHRPKMLGKLQAE